MAKYRILGVWKNENNDITHYAFLENGMDKVEKISKLNAIKLLDGTENTAKTGRWDYENACWVAGASVKVDGSNYNGKYLRSDPDDTEIDNIRHLIILNKLT